MPAEFTWGRWLGAVDGRSKFKGQAAPTHTGGTHKKVGVAHISMYEMLFEQGFRPAVSDKVPSHEAIVAQRGKRRNRKGRERRIESGE
jgi:hypothetical protein